MKDRLSKKEILDRYQNSSMIVDLRSLLKEKEEAEKTSEDNKEKIRNKKKKKKEEPKRKKKEKLEKGRNSFFKKIFIKKDSSLASENSYEQDFSLDNDLAASLRKKSFNKKRKIFQKTAKVPAIISKNNAFSLKVTAKIKKERKQISKLLEKRELLLKARLSDFFQRPSLEYKQAFRERKGIISRLPGFLIALVILILPLKVFSSLGILDIKNIENKIFTNSYQAVNNIISATDSISKLNFKEADYDFSQANINFLAAEEELAKINDSLLFLASLSSNPKMQLASQSKNFLAAGVTASSLAKNLLASSESLLNKDENINFNDALEAFIFNISLAKEDSNRLKNLLNNLKPEVLPIEYQAKLMALRDQISFLDESLSEFIRLSDKLKDILGLSVDKRYLLVFQNNAEIRASGGFLGSYALVDIRDGKIRNLEVPAGGSYDLEAGLKGKKFSSPYPLHLVNPLWNFWDANWWPAWPKTAKHLMWFYEQSSGPSVDGVISLTPTVVEKLLKVTGDIDMSKEYGLIINADNFWETVQKVVEYKNLELSHPDYLEGIASSSKVISVEIPLNQDLENNPDNKPKKIIGDLMARILEVLPDKINLESLPAIVSLFSDSISEKHILFYFKDEKLQEEALHYGLAGELKDYDHDYLLIVDSNIAGQKTDKLMRQEVSLVSEVQHDGQIINTLTIDRHHPGEKDQAFTGVRNVNWLRVYVPQGSELISFSGSSKPDESYFDDYDSEAILLPALKAEREAKIDELSGTLSYDEDGRSVFANWTMTDPGQISRIEIKYKLPFNFNTLKSNNKSTYLEKLYYWLNPELQENFPYSLIIQKQAGAKSFPLKLKLVTNDTYDVFWSTEKKGVAADRYLFNLVTEINRDRFFGALLNMKKIQN